MITKQIYCVWYAKGYQAAEKAYSASISFNLICDTKNGIENSNFANKCEKELDSCMSKKVLLASFINEDDAEKFIELLSVEFKRNSFVEIEKVMCL